MLLSWTVFVNESGCARSRALMLAQDRPRVLHETLAGIAIAKQFGNSALQRVGIGNLNCTVL